MLSLIRTLLKLGSRAPSFLRLLGSASFTSKAGLIILAVLLTLLASSSAAGYYFYKKYQTARPAVQQAQQLQDELILREEIVDDLMQQQERIRATYRGKLRRLQRALAGSSDDCARRRVPADIVRLLADAPAKPSDVPPARTDP